MHLSCGDSFYEEGEDGMPIIFGPESNLIEWVFAMQKLLVFVRSENARATEIAEKASQDGWIQVAKRVTVSCAHQTSSIDGEKVLEALEKFSARVFQGKVPVVKKGRGYDGEWWVWREEDKEVQFSMQLPPRLMDAARKFFNLYVDSA